MYLALGLIVLAVLFAIVGVASGGAFTLVLVPLAVIGLVGAAAALASARAAGLRGTLAQPPQKPPRGPAHQEEERPPGEVPVTPDEYIESRQRSQ